MRRPKMTQMFPWLLALALATPACGDDDTTLNDAGAAGEGSAGRTAASGRGGNGGSTSKGGTGGSSKGGAGGRGGQGGSKAGAGGSVSEVRLDDAQIASVLLTANQGEVEQNNVAVTKAERRAVHDLAQDFVDMHTAATTRENALFTALDITPSDNPVSAQLRDKSASAVSKLKAASASEFDAVFLQSQVDAHQSVLDLVDDNLLKNVSDAGLRAEITALRLTVEMHLVRTRALLAALNDGSDAGVDDAGL
jgi:putative membrane protein